ncbi:hypothetical protein BKA62DRAFT_46646 [Auriculariales sp. MPI-PUGE-AT-0066]|nr:hypothetical protein BKA62DRAFT_46646 [Auriculariales sp. MPI-PUGE-AT-0066]
MASMAEGLPWPLKAAPQTAMQVISHLEEFRTIEPRVKVLLDSIAEFSRLLVKYHDDRKEDEEMIPHLRGFMQRLQVIYIRIRVCKSAGRMKNLAAASRVHIIIETEIENVARGRDLLMTAFASSTRSHVGDIRKLLLSSPRATTRTCSSAYLSSAIPPPMPIIFYGRDELVEIYVAMILALEPARIAIFGAGGIGKTTLALAVLHDERVREQSGDARLFVSCEGLVDSNGLLALLAHLLALDLCDNLLDMLLQHFKSRPSMLLILDNLETLWMSKNSSVQSELNQVLGQLASVEQLNIIITSRGTFLPDSVIWSNRQGAVLDILLPDAAYRVFVETAHDEPTTSVEHDALEELLRAVDYLPLAVHLLALLQEQPSALLKQWKKLHTELLQVDIHDRTRRELSVEVSIQVSIRYLPTETVDPEPLELLALCSLLPDGLFPDTVEQLRPMFARLDRAMRLLRNHALIYIGVSGELKMLSPIRLYIQKQYPISGRHFGCIRSRYYTLAATVPTEPANDFLTRSAQVAAEIGNLTSFLLHLVDTESPSEELSNAVGSTTAHIFWTSQSLSLQTTWVKRLGTFRSSENKSWLARAYHDLGRSRHHLRDFEGAKESFGMARNLCMELGDTSQAMLSAICMASCMRIQNLYADAIRLITDARSFYMTQSNAPKVALCDRQLGQLFNDTKQYDKALQYYQFAYDGLKADDQQQPAAETLLHLGITHVEMGNNSEAKTVLQQGLDDLQSYGDVGGAAYCKMYLGDLKRQAGDFEEAEQLIASARTDWTTAGSEDLYGVAECGWFLGLVRRDQGQLTEAVELFTACRDFNVSLGDEDHAGECERELVELRQRLSTGLQSQT